MWKKLIALLDVIGNISRNLLSFAALIVGLWAIIVYISGDSPIQRLKDVFDNGRRLSNATGWVWLGDGQTREQYKFILLKGEWTKIQEIETLRPGALVRVTAKSNVRDGAGPRANEISYLVRGDCVEITESKIVGDWAWVKVKATDCSE